MAIVQIVDIIENIVSKLTYTVIISSNTDNGAGKHVLFTSNTYYCTKTNKVTIGGVVYKITNVDFNVSITVEPVNHTTSIVATSFDLKAPTFFHGTVYSTDKEILLDTERNRDVYPIVYLYESLKETVIHDKTDPSERIVPIRLFLLDLSKWNNNLNAYFLTDVLKPLSNVESKLFEQIAKSKVLEELSDNGSRENIARFGVTDQYGVTKVIFSEELSGIELNMNIPITRNCKCC